MIVFPAIDIKGGQCVRLLQGRQDQVTTYFNDPVAVAEKWADEGAAYLHVVDLDGAFAGDGKNTDVIGRICQAVSIPVEVGGGIRSEEAIKLHLKNGVSRVIIGSKAVEDSVFITEMAAKYGDKIAVSVDAHGNQVATHGWVDKSTTEVLPFTKFLLSIGIHTIIYTDISRDGMLQGPNLAMMARLQALSGIRLVASGGVSSIQDLLDLAGLSIYGAITGKALYEGKVTMAQIRAL